VESRKGILFLAESILKKRKKPHTDVPDLKFINCRGTLSHLGGKPGRRAHRGNIARGGQSFWISLASQEGRKGGWSTLGGNTPEKKRATT